jgi:hypothetical protein
VQQPTNWSCAPSSLAWALTAVGRPTTAWDAIDLCSRVVDPNQGLLDSSGSGVVRLLQSLGYEADNVNPVSWDELTRRAGRYATMIGGRAWGDSGHWSGMSAFNADTGGLVLKNPTEGFTGVGSELDVNEWRARGTWSCVSILGRRGRTRGAVPDLLADSTMTSQAVMQRLTGAVADDLQASIDPLDDALPLKATLRATLDDLRARGEMVAQLEDLPPAVRSERLARATNDIAGTFAQELNTTIASLDDAEPMKARLQTVAQTLRQGHPWFVETQQLVRRR